MSIMRTFIVVHFRKSNYIFPIAEVNIDIYNNSFLGASIISYETSGTYRFTPGFLGIEGAKAQIYVRTSSNVHAIIF